MRMFHRRLMNHLGVVRAEVEDPWDYESSIRMLQDIAASRGQYTSMSCSTASLSTPSTYQSGWPGRKPLRQGHPSGALTNQKMELSNLLNMPTLLLPEGVGDPESGAGGPPAALKAIFDLVSGATNRGGETTLAQGHHQHQLALGAPEDSNSRQHGSGSIYLSNRPNTPLNQSVKASMTKDFEESQSILKSVNRNSYGGN